mmetsp:Transcript_28242/g.31370  ORF Transcript_28242/g.31370 Transcript_28242/m.31370 type:complete len:789 (+) Transcript_28242:23-2389(+)
MLSLKVRFFNSEGYKTWSFPKHFSATRITEEILATADIDSPNIYTVFIPWPKRASSPISKGGVYMEQEQPLSSLELIDGDCIILKYKPETLNIVVATSFPIAINQAKSSCTTVSVNYHDPIHEFVKRLLAKKEIPQEKHGYSYRAVLLTRDKVDEKQFLNSNLSLHEQEFPENGYFCLYPIKFLRQVPLESLTDTKKKGYLQKRSIKNGELTPEYRRYFVLKDHFLWYYLNSKSTSPKGCIALDTYSIVYTNTNGRDHSFELHPSANSLGTKRSIYILIAESDQERHDWATRLQAATVDFSKITFGVKLKTLLSTRDHGEDVPKILSLTTKILSEKLDTEGLFRVPGAASTIRQLKESFNSGENPEMSRSDAHGVGGILKLWLRELPEPLMTYDLYEQCLRDKTGSLSTEELGKRLQALPKYNQLALSHLINFLSNVSKESEVNKMTVDNLAMVFGPALLSNKDESSQAFITGAKTSSSVVRMLLGNAPKYVRILERAKSAEPDTSSPEYVEEKLKTLRAQTSGNKSSKKSPKQRVLQTPKLEKIPTPGAAGSLTPPTLLSSIRRSNTLSNAMRPAVPNEPTPSWKTESRDKAPGFVKGSLSVRGRRNRSSSSSGGHRRPSKMSIGVRRPTIAASPPKPTQPRSFLSNRNIPKVSQPPKAPPKHMKRSFTSPARGGDKQNGNGTSDKGRPRKYSGFSIHPEELTKLRTTVLDAVNDNSARPIPLSQSTPTMSIFRDDKESEELLALRRRVAELEVALAEEKQARLEAEEARQRMANKMMKMAAQFMPE